MAETASFETPPTGSGEIIEDARPELTTPNWHPIEKITSRHSSWRLVKKVVAWLLKIKQVLRNPGGNHNKQVTPKDLEEAEEEIIRFCQTNIKKELSEGRNTELKQLNAYVDRKGIIRVGGRTRRLNTNNEDQKITRDGNVAKMIISTKWGTWVLSIL